MVELVPEKVGPWTFDDLQSLPDESGWRYEIVDGALVVSPGPALRHEVVGELLRRCLREVLPPHVITVGPMAVDLEPTYRLPDLVVVDLDTDDTTKLAAADVHLAIEIVSPSSTTTDRVTKPAEYAAHGLLAYWRVETDPEVSVTAYVLGEGDAVYTEVGTWGEGETLSVAVPFAIDLSVDDLTRGRP
ncbi:Uma2 family endonuclease [Nocardioides sp.]|uniref:Uma2 family endonuclease n=1 Tax=Nocardioides sp. TaxID=35761 RepID=UPI0027185BA2|nr:Uma2 family endonuclease [Nocardioides sp.]MDO9455952.1 Uma2 family endonuclease [Nocardioides sp.]